MTPTLEYARARDEADVLRPFRERFAMPKDSSGAQLLYLCGHSLGLMPLGARKLVDEELDNWANLGVLGHEAAAEFPGRDGVLHDGLLRQGCEIVQ